MALKVIVLGQDAGAEEFFLEDLHEVQEVLGLAATDVVHFVRRDGETVFAGFLLGGFAHHPHNTLHNIIYIGEVTTAVAVVVYLDGVAFQQFVGEAEIGHIGSTGRAIDGEETQARRGDVIQLAVAVGHELVALLRCGIETHGVVHTVVGAEGDLLVTAVDRA